MGAAAKLALLRVQLLGIRNRRQPIAHMGVRQLPELLEESERTLYSGVGPFQSLLRRRAEHHVQAHGIGTVLLDERFRVDGVALRLGHFGAVFQHHSLGQEVGEGLSDWNQALVTHQALKESRVEQMQNSVLDAADVLVHRHPVGGALVQHGGIAIAAREACEVPGGLDECVQGVGLALGGSTALRAGGLVEGRDLTERRHHALHLHVFRETHGQIFVGNRQRSAGIAVDYGHRATPVALAGYTPVSQAVVDGLVSETPLLQPLGD